VVNESGILYYLQAFPDVAERLAKTSLSKRIFADYVKIVQKNYSPTQKRENAPNRVRRIRPSDASFPRTGDLGIRETFTNPNESKIILRLCLTL
jgi:hypothetical protein